MREAVIVSTARTGIGRAYRGSLNYTKSPSMLGHVITHAVQRADIEGAHVKKAVIGTVLGAGTGDRNLARFAVLATGLPVAVAGQTMDRQYASGLMAIATAAKKVMVDSMDIVVAGGLENITALQKSLFDEANVQKDPQVTRHVQHAYMSMLQTAEFVVAKYGISRQAQDVLIENFRPGTMESWNLGWEELHALNPKLIVLRVSGYGGTGPYSGKPGFGTLCEGMSGFAELNGHADGPPTVAPMAVGDCIVGLYGAVGVLVALFARVQGLCQGQTVDVSLLDSLFSIIAYQVAEYEHIGKVLERSGNRSTSSVPRNIYRTRDNHWIMVSSPSNTLALRVLRINTPGARSRNADAIDALVAAWVLERDLAQAMVQFEKFDTAAAPTYDIGQIFNDPQFRSSETLIKVQDDELGPMHMPNIVPRLSATPGAVRFAGRSLGRDTQQVLRERKSLSEGQIRELQKLGTV
jgi:crotonobetainyl-CoA:carnitine CoA-transferase CaiB-like acyl-CoA transferase